MAMVPKLLMSICLACNRQPTLPTCMPGMTCQVPSAAAMSLLGALLAQRSCMLAELIASHVLPKVTIYSLLCGGPSCNAHMEARRPHGVGGKPALAVQASAAMYSAVLNATECVPDLNEDFCIVDEYIVELSVWDSIQANNCTLLCPEAGSLTCPAAPGPAPAAAFGALPPPTIAGAAAPAAAVAGASAVTTVPGDELQSCVGFSLGSQLLQYAACAKLWVVHHGQPAVCNTTCADRPVQT